MKKIFKQYCRIILIAMAILSACKKQDEFLDALPKSNLAVPSTFSELELMCFDQSTFNTGDAMYPLISADRYFVSDIYFNGSLIIQQQAAHIWAKDLQLNQSYNLGDWNQQYKKILAANTILEALDRLNYDAGDQPKANAIRGMALFYRAWAFYQLARTFCMPYDSSKADSQIGIPLRLKPAQEIASVRANLKETYDRIIGDFKEAISLLPATSANVATPNNISAKGALARVYLMLGDYKNSLEMCNGFLQQFSTITDFSTLVPSSTRISSTTTVPLSEDVFHSSIFSTGLAVAGQSQVQVDPLLYSSYDADDIRRTAYFTLSSDGTRRYFRGTYDNIRGSLFDGIATDELLLTRAECNARRGSPQLALDDLNRLLKLRYKPGKFNDYTLANTPDVLTLVLKEREKELHMRGLRWDDIRRLNKDPNRAITLQRTINGTIYSLSPNDPRFAISIPDNEILLSGIQQNPRQ